MKKPATGGRWFRDPKTGALRKTPGTGDAPEPEAAPAEVVREPQPDKSKGAK